MAVKLQHELVLLCEGKADQNFLRALLENRGGFPPFFMFEPSEEHSGVTSFSRQLQALRGDPIGFSRVRRIVIVADSGNDPARTFDSIRSQVAAAGNYPVPATLSAVEHPASSALGVAIMLLPEDSGPGGLETLCVEALSARHPGTLNCVEQFLRCNPITAYTWTPEKLDKSRYHCIVAACNQDDPSRSVSSAFMSSRPVVDVGHSCFDQVETRLRALCAL
jgi:hypothetical protein